MKKISEFVLVPLFMIYLVIGIVTTLTGHSQTLKSTASPASFTKAITSSGVLVAGSSVQVVATSTTRNYLEIDTTGSMVYCNADNGKAATLYNGFHIASSTKYVFSADTDNLYKGAVNCIADGPTSTTTVIQF